MGTFIGTARSPQSRSRACAAGVSRARVLPILAIASLLAAIFLYLPALGGGPILDDLALPLADDGQPLSTVLSGTRPVLILSYRLNGLVLGHSLTGYHAVNLLIHVVNVWLVFLILERLLRRAGWRERESSAAGCGGALMFLIHPLQTESVSYIAGRSESLASLFALLAYAVFLNKARDAISWRRALSVMLLFGLAVGTKENAVSLAGILLLTDLMGPQGFAVKGLRRNWRLYALMLPGALVAGAAVFRMLASAGTAGFSVAKYTWYQYAFTEARAIFAYLRLAIVPVGQSLDHDFATSRTIVEHGAVFYIAALAGLAAVAIRRARDWPLASFGFLMFLTWLAPTSSVVPIDDALVERRTYLPLMGLILIACDAAQRWRSRRAMYAAAAGVMLLFGGLCQARNQLWSNPELLIAQAAQEAQHNPRPLLNLAEALIRRNRCELALPYLDRADRILPGSYFVHSIRGRALACMGRREEAMAHLQLAAQIRPSSEVHQWIGLLYGDMGRLADAGASFQRAVELEPKSAAAHAALAFWYEKTGDFAGAEREYALSLSLNSKEDAARAGLERVRWRDSQP